MCKNYFFVLPQLMVYRIWGHCIVFMKEICDTGGASLWLRVSIIDRILLGRPAEMLRVICNGLPHLQGRRGGERSLAPVEERRVRGFWLHNNYIYLIHP